MMISGTADWTPAAKFEGYMGPLAAELTDGCLNPIRLDILRYATERVIHRHELRPPRGKSTAPGQGTTQGVLRRMPISIYR